MESLREKCPYSELFWSVFSRMWNAGNTDQNNSEYGHFLRCECFRKNPTSQIFDKTFILNRNTEEDVQECSEKNAVRKNLRKFWRKNKLMNPFSVNLHTTTSLKKELRHRFFAADFAKICEGSIRFWYFMSFWKPYYTVKINLWKHSTSFNSRQNVSLQCSLFRVSVKSFMAEVNLLCKLMDWFLYDRNLCHERVKVCYFIIVKEKFETRIIHYCSSLKFKWRIIRQEFSEMWKGNFFTPRWNFRIRKMST